MYLASSKPGKPQPQLYRVGAKAAQRDTLQKRLPLFLVKLFRHLGLDEAGSDGVGSNAAGAYLFGDGTGQADNSSLAEA